MTEVLWAAMMKNVLDTGVIKGTAITHTLAVAPSTGLSVTVDLGEAWVYGHWYQNSIVQTLVFDPNTNAAGTRADLVVLDCKWGLDAGIHLAIVKGTPGAVWPSGNGSLTGTPQTTDPITLVGVEWQLPIYQVNIRYQATSILASDLTDWRNYVTAGTAKSATYVLCDSDTTSPGCSASADACVPAGSLHAEDLINKALNTISSTYGGGTLQLCEGTYRTSAPIVVPSNCNLVGMGNNTLIQIQIAGGAVPVISIPTQTDITLHDFAIDCGGSFNPTSPPAAVAGADGILVTDSMRVKIKDLVISGARGFGINLASTASSTASYGHRVEGCLIQGSSNAGIRQTGCRGRITNNHLTNNLNGIILDGTSSTLGALANVISTNTIDLNAEVGILLGESGANSHFVQHNTISNNEITDNCIQADNTYACVSVLGQYAIRNFITGNQVVDTAQTYKPLYGIYLDATVSYNTVMNNECSAAAKTTANNIVSAGNTTSAKSPNWLRFNRSGSVSSGAASYDD
jgi:hypothetical protein